MAQIDRNLTAMADQAVSRLADSSAREAIMAVRSEAFRLFEMSNDRFEELVAQIAEQGKQVAVLIKAMEGDRSRDDQWKQSAQRVFEGFTKQLAEHAKADEDYQDRIDKRWGSLQWWLVGTLISLLGGSWIVIGMFVWKALYGHAG